MRCFASLLRWTVRGFTDIGATQAKKLSVNQEKEEAAETDGGKG
jgi:hypothetical protein